MFQIGAEVTSVLLKLKFGFFSTKFIFNLKLKMNFVEKTHESVDAILL